MINRRQFLIGAVTMLAGSAGCTLKLKDRQLPDPGLSEQEPVEGPQPVLRIALLSDPHTVARDSDLAGAINGKLVTATRDLMRLKPDLWVVSGDIADRGRQAEFTAFKEIMARVASPEQLMVTTGNHNFYDPEADDATQLQRFQQAFGLERPYSSRLLGDLHLVTLATEQYRTAPAPREWAWLTAAQLQWFETVLNAHPNRFTAVFLHQPLQDTVVGSHGGNDHGGCGQAAELRAILRANPQVKLWFSGHTHMGAEEPGNLAEQEGIIHRNPLDLLPVCPGREPARTLLRGVQERSECQPESGAGAVAGPGADPLSGPPQEQVDGGAGGRPTAGIACRFGHNLPRGEGEPCTGHA